MYEIKKQKKKEKKRKKGRNVDNRQRTEDRERESKIANIPGLHWAFKGHPWMI